MTDPIVAARAFLARWDDDVPDSIEAMNHLRAALAEIDRLTAERDHAVARLADVRAVLTGGRDCADFAAAEALRERDQLRAHVNDIDVVLFPAMPDEERAQITPEARMERLGEVVCAVGRARLVGELKL